MSSRRRSRASSPTRGVTTYCSSTSPATACSHRAAASTSPRSRRPSTCCGRRRSRTASSTTPCSDSRARSIVLILDCCYSGAFGKGLAPKSAPTVDVEQRFEGRGRVTLSASTEPQYAFEAADPATGMDELGAAAPGSLFTHFLVEGLATGDADTDGDGSISVDELYDYVRQRMHERGRAPDAEPGRRRARRHRDRPQPARRPSTSRRARGYHPPIKPHPRLPGRRQAAAPGFASRSLARGVVAPGPSSWYRLPSASSREPGTARRSSR